MTILSTIRRQHRARSRTVLGLLALVWLNVALQTCALAASGTELTVDRPIQSEMLISTGNHTAHVPDSLCELRVDCQNNGCLEHSVCDAPVVVSTQAELRLPDNLEFETAAAVFHSDFDAVVTEPIASPARHVHRVTAAAVPLTVQYCVYLI